MTSEPRAPRFTPKLVLGLALIGLGLLLTLEQLGWPVAWRALPFWPLIPAAFGLARLRQRGWAHLGGHIWLALALAGALAQLGREDLLERWWPLFVVWGCLVIALRGIPSTHPKPSCLNGEMGPNTLATLHPPSDSPGVIAPNPITPPDSCDPGSSQPREGHDPLP